MDTKQQISTRFLRLNRKELESLGVNMIGVTYKVSRDGLVVRVMGNGLVSFEHLLAIHDHFGQVQELWNRKKIKNPWENYRV